MKFLGIWPLLVVIGTISRATAAPANWPQFRGLEGSGVSVDAKPPTKLGPTESVLWSVEVPWSPSSPSVWGDRIFLTTFREGELETRCHARADGRMLWARGIKPEKIEEFHRSDGSPAASSPATDGHHVISYFGSFGLVCYDVDGKELWRHPMPAAVSAGQYGTGTSPIIVGQSVVLNRDQFRDSSLLALDLSTGTRLWETGRPDSFGSFGTPTSWRNNDMDEVVTAASGRLKGYDLKTGVERWSIEGVTGYVCTTPVVAEGRLYFGAWSAAAVENSLPPWVEFLKMFDKNGDGEVAFDEIDVSQRDYWRGLDLNHDGKYTQEDWELRIARTARFQNVMVAVMPGGTGNITKTHVAWTFARGLPYVPSPLCYQGRIYMVKDGGLFTSLDAKTGEAFYTQERIGAAGSYYASPVAADGRIYLASLTGKLTVVAAGGRTPEILHQVDFGSRILATPALVGENLYLRTAAHLWAFGKQKRSASDSASITVIPLRPDRP